MNPPEEMPSFPQTVFETVAERQTYYNIAYLMLSFPLGLFYFVYLVTMLSLGFGLAVTVVGLPLIGLTLVTAQALAASTCKLSGRLLGMAMPRQRVSATRRQGSWSALLHKITERAAWRDVCFLLLLFPLGTLNFTLVLSLLGASLWMIAQPLLVLARVHSEIAPHWHIDTLPKALLFPIPGFLLALASLHLLNYLASLSGHFTRSMLGRVGYRELRLATARTLIDGRWLDGATILSELRLYHGYSRDFTPMKVFATLTALEEAGLVASADQDGSVRYSLTRTGEAELAAQ